jgi:hypothetical protein
MQLAELFANAGLEVRTSFGTDTAGVKVFVRDVYNALNNGSDNVVVLDAGTDESIVELLASAEEVESGDTLILRNTDCFTKGKRKGESYDAKTLMQRINARNAAHVTDGDTDTYGSVKMVSPLYDGDTLHGFTVQRTA